MELNRNPEQVFSFFLILFYFLTYRRFGRECSDDPIGIDLKKMSSPTNFGVRANFHAFLAVSHLLSVKVHVSKV